MKNYLLLIIFCITSVGCQSFRASRKPQSAGFAGYCPTCITENIDKDLAKLSNTVKTSNTVSYKTDVGAKCAKGFVEGVIVPFVPSYKECLNPKWLVRSNRYYTNVGAKCAKGFVEGIKIKHETNYNEKVCWNKNIFIK